VYTAAVREGAVPSIHDAYTYICQARTLSLIHTHTHSLTHSLTQLLSLSLSPSLSLSLSLSLNSLSLNSLSLNSLSRTHTSVFQARAFPVLCTHAPTRLSASLREKWHALLFQTLIYARGGPSLTHAHSKHARMHALAHLSSGGSIAHSGRERIGEGEAD
jgi:hypothetical protein